MTEIKKVSLPEDNQEDDTSIQHLDDQELDETITSEKNTHPSQPKWHPLKPKNLALFGTIVLFFIVATSGYVFYIKRKSANETRNFKSIVRYSIPLPDYMARESIYLLAKSQNSEDFIRLDLIIYFSALNHLECYKRNALVYRDVMYHYLKAQKPDRNAMRSWSKIVGQKLSGYLKQKYNACRVERVRLELLQRL
ncbi:MAG: hypothetical protein JRI45_09535 [Deltaproteobacteria bacterium]|nr:hypothetical protein [Deltaproteobacteria bacterium]MBW2068323.1 hypothetical protein [Deltaproteobacteria bacterium]